MSNLIIDPRQPTPEMGQAVSHLIVSILSSRPDLAQLLKPGFKVQVHCAKGLVLEMSGALESGPVAKGIIT